MATNSTQESVFGAMSFAPLRGEPTMGSIPMPTIAVTTATLTTAGGALTLTAAEIIGGLLLLNCDDAQNAVTPSAALLIAAIPGVADEQSFQFDIRNTGDATLTVTAGAGVTTSGTMTIATANGKRFLVRITDATQASPTYTIYSLGTYTF